MKIERAIQKRDTYNKGKILVVDIREAIQSVDPKIPSSALEEYLARGLQCDLREVRWDVHVDYDIFFSQLKLGLLKKTGSWIPDPPLQMPSILRARTRAVRRRETQKRRKMRRTETKKRRRESKKRNSTVRALEKISGDDGVGGGGTASEGGEDSDPGTDGGGIGVGGWNDSAPTVSDFGSPMAIGRVLERGHEEDDEEEEQKAREAKKGEEQQEKKGREQQQLRVPHRPPLINASPSREARARARPRVRRRDGDSSTPPRRKALSGEGVERAWENGDCRHSVRIVG